MKTSQSSSSGHFELEYSYGTFLPELMLVIMWISVIAHMQFPSEPNLPPSTSYRMYM